MSISVKVDINMFLLLSALLHQREVVIACNIKLTGIKSKSTQQGPASTIKPLKGFLIYYRVQLPPLVVNSMSMHWTT